MAAPTIVSTSPSSGAVSVPINTSISVTFDQEIDTYRLKNGGIFIEGPDETKSIGAGFLDLYPLETDEDKMLSSPGYKGIIKEVDYAFKRVDGSGNEVSYYDYGSGTDAGTRYRTKVILTPQEPLAARTEYTVYIVGDSDTSDEFDFGLTNRTVFDVIKGSNTGTGNAYFYGGYTGTVRKQFFIEITTAGTVGTAEFEWWTSRDAIHRTGVTSAGYRLLEDDVYLKFDRGVNYEIGDTYSVWCDVPEFMEGFYKFSFITSDQSPETLPTASTILSSPSGSTSSSTSTSSFSVSTISPEDGASMVSDDLSSIVITFSDTLNSATITNSTVSITGNASDGSPSGIDFTETLSWTASVSGAVLTLTLDPTELYENNIITLTLDSTIASSGGVTLGADKEYFFATTYNPYYTGRRYVLLRLGYAGTDLPTETIDFAIWEASREADSFGPQAQYWADVQAFNRARREFVSCFAAWMLLVGTSNLSGQSIRKRLGDFDVSRSGNGSDGDLDDKLENCWMYYRELMLSGGDLASSGTPQTVIKGGSSPDNPLFGRLWGSPRTGLVNTKVRYSGQRRWKSTYYRRSKK